MMEAVDRDHGYECKCGWDLNRELVFDCERRDTQRTMDQLSDDSSCNPLLFHDFAIQNSQDSNAVSDNEERA